ncbi:UNVERIFIED_CONTAM: hypothetical protein NCL1_31801 [Trichonephila clavipes]
MARAVIEQLMDEDMMDATGVIEGIEKRTVPRILQNELHLHKIAARWVPHALTEAQRTTGTSWCDVRDKRRDLVDSAITLHDNATYSRASTQLLRRWEWEELEHPPYSPDISPCDFDIIPKIKELIRGRSLS